MLKMPLSELKVFQIFKIGLQNRKKTATTKVFPFLVCPFCAWYTHGEWVLNSHGEYPWRPKGSKILKLGHGVEFNLNTGRGTKKTEDVWAIQYYTIHRSLNSHQNSLNCQRHKNTVFNNDKIYFLYECLMKR